jgi:hypothetical protein
MSILSFLRDKSTFTERARAVEGLGCMWEKAYYLLNRVNLHE